MWIYIFFEILKSFYFLWSFNIKVTFITSNVHLLMQGLKHWQKVKSPQKEKEKEEEFPLAFHAEGKKTQGGKNSPNSIISKDILLSKTQRIGTIFQVAKKINELNCDQRAIICRRRKKQCDFLLVFPQFFPMSAQFIRKKPKGVG